MTPIAVLCWFAYRGHLPLAGTWGQWAGRPVSVIVFAVLAVGELIGDKLPMTPNRRRYSLWLQGFASAG